MAAERSAALLLSAESPYPLAGGGALRTASLLHYLAGRYDTDLIVFRQPGSADPLQSLPSGLVRRVLAIDLPAHSRAPIARAIRNGIRLARRVPPLVDRFAGFQRAVAAATAGRRYALGVVEHFWCAPYAEQLAPVCDRIVLDLHNIESVLHERCAAAETPGPAAAHRVFARAARRMERRWLLRFDSVLVASAEDARAAKEIAAGARVSVYPNAIPDFPAPTAPRDEAIAFSGNLEYHPNRMAVRFFRREIWPLIRVRFPDVVWRLIGKNPQAVEDWTAGDPRIQVVGAVEDAVAELARCRLAVVPLLAGSGTRLKILEAWAAGLPVVSTTVGAEGLGAVDGEHLLIADSAAAFADAVARLLACRDLGAKLSTAGRLLLDKEFTWCAAWRRLDF